ncbi:MAG: hypothetical protein WC765_08505 [Phycisphaerae bacterium]|jgi:hypothetical protein
MNTRLTIIALVLGVLFTTSAFAVDLLDPKSVFSGDAEVCLSDGSSLYIFHPNGEFTLEPLGISGRTIEGKWNYDSEGLHITGIWSWINGSSVHNDRREMDIHVGYVGSKTTDYSSRITAKQHKIQEAYFLIDRIEKQKLWPTNVSPGGSLPKANHD